MPKHRVKVKARYLVEKEMEVILEEGEDPQDPDTWIDIPYEHDTDCSLYEVLDYSLIGDEP